MLDASQQFFSQGADVLGLSDNVREILITPKRTVKVEIVTEGDSSGGSSSAVQADRKRRDLF